MPLPTCECVGELPPNEKLNAIYCALLQVASNADDFAFMVNVQNFGALGDGVTDDTAAINSAAAVINQRGGTLYFPAGEYVVSDTIILTGVPLDDGSPGGANGGGFRILGDSANASIIRYTGASTLFQFGTGSVVVKHTRAESISLIGPGADGTSVGIDFPTTSGFFSMAHVVAFSWGQAAVRANDLTYFTASECEFNVSQRGIAAGYKSDLWTLNNCGFFGNEIGFDLGYYDPNTSPVVFPWGGAGVLLQGCGFAQNRIPMVLGGVNSAALRVQNCYWEDNTQCVAMLGHDPAEDWFPGDAARNTAQALDAVAGSMRLTMTDGYLQGDAAGILAYREVQIEINRIVGALDSGGVLSLMNSVADDSSISISQSTGPITWSDSETTPLYEVDGFTYPPKVPSAAHSSVGTSIAGAASVLVTDVITVISPLFTGAASSYVWGPAPAEGSVNVSAMTSATVPISGSSFILQVQKWNGASWDWILGGRLDTQTTTVASQALSIGGHTTVPVVRGDLLRVIAFSSGTFTTDADFGRVSYQYVSK